MARDRYPVIDVSSWELLGLEADGLREHPWLLDPETDSTWLWKPAVLHAERQQGEDWSEKIASELGSTLGLPCARVKLARRGPRAGCVSLDLRPPGWELQPGAVLLAGLVDGYQSRIKGRPGHSLPNIRRALDGYSVPPNAEGLPASFDAFEVLAGYLVFDALIANRDRHDHNWAVLRPPPEAKGTDCLCGSYDHASSLGFNLLDEERARWLSLGNVAQWARRGTAYKFEHDLSHQPPTLVQLAHRALTMCRTEAKQFWLDAVANLSRDVFEALVEPVPELSDVTARFIVELMIINRRRVLDGQ